MNLEKDNNPTNLEQTTAALNPSTDTAHATANPYQAPQTSVQPPTLNAVKSYYTVSKKKFFILYFMTFSLYSIYWFYKNWKMWKLANNEKIWPIPRALFNIFFAHSLFNKIHADATQVSNTTLPSLGSVATIYVITQIVTSLINSIFSETYLAESMVVIILCMTLIGWSLWQAQRQANIASLDELGSQNSRLSGLNILIIVLGVIFWIFTIIGIVVDAMGLIY